MITFYSNDLSSILTGVQIFSKIVVENNEKKQTRPGMVH